MLCTSHKSCRKCAVELVAEWQRRLLLVNAQGSELARQATNNLFVLFRLEAASAVNEHASRFEKRQHRAQDFELSRLHLGELGWLQPPPQIGPTTHHTG